MRHRFPLLNLIQPFSDARKKLQPLGDGVQTRIVRKPLDGLQGKLLVTHGFTVRRKGRKCNGTSPKSIREAGRTLVQRNTFYEPIRVLEDAPAVSGSDSLQVGSKSKVLEDNLATG